MSIPVKNIYYLLCYAWNNLQERDRIDVSADENTELYDLFARVLINATRVLLKRGIDRDYTEVTSELNGIKGKLDLSATLKRNILAFNKTSCTYGELSPNVITNRILVTTLKRLINAEDLDRNLKFEIRKLLGMFAETEFIELRASLFKQIRLHRNNNFYRFIINICNLIYENSLPSEVPGKWKFSDFTRDEKKMSRLFEEFLRNFYNLEQSEYSVKREDINWKFLSNSNNDLNYLPKMQTDITLENNDNKIIIDAKYYKETMSSNYDKEKIWSANMYQLFSYLINQENNSNRTKTARGILLYPTISQDYDLQYRFGLHHIHIKTVNLNMSWKNIEIRLKDIVKINNNS